jgi:uncharacterized membrane protein YkoI
MMLRRVLILTTAGVLTLAAAAPVFAESNDDEQNGNDEVLAAAAAPVTLGQAITAAEGKTGGRAVDAGYEDVDGATVIRVQLIKDNAVIQARVDAKSGEVLATAAKQDEEDDEE